MNKTDPWRKKLTPEEYTVLREKGTEAPFSGALLHNKASGMYHCKACGAELFSSDAKYEATEAGLEGWPSFCEVINNHAVEIKEDRSHGMRRLEVVCAHCHGHLGHVFKADDSPTGIHYCINSVALNFKKGKK